MLSCILFLLKWNFKWFSRAWILRLFVLSQDCSSVFGKPCSFVEVLHIINRCAVSTGITADCHRLTHEKQSRSYRSYVFVFIPNSSPHASVKNGFEPGQRLSYGSQGVYHSRLSCMIKYSLWSLPFSECAKGVCQVWLQKYQNCMLHSIMHSGKTFLKNDHNRSQSEAILHSESCARYTHPETQGFGIGPKWSTFNFMYLWRKA